MHTPLYNADWPLQAVHAPVVASVVMQPAGAPRGGGGGGVAGGGGGVLETLHVKD